MKYCIGKKRLICNSVIDEVLSIGDLLTIDCNEKEESIDM
jgi:hypothetical protein